MRGLSLFALVQSHLLGNPEAHAPADEAQPHHQIVLFGAVEFRHSLAEEAGVDEETRNTCNRVMLEKKKWFVSLEPGLLESLVNLLAA